MSESDANGHRENDESARWRAELALKEREIRVKETEVEIKVREDARSRYTNPLFLAFMAAALAAGGNAFVAGYNAREQRKLEDQKTESNLIIEVVKINNPDKAAANLAFLLDTGLVAEGPRREHIKSYLTNRRSGQHPLLLEAGSISECPDEQQGDYVVSDVHWGDEAGGLVLRSSPNGTPIGVIPGTATGVSIVDCPGEKWCEVRYKCITGWAFYKYLSPQRARLRVIQGVDSNRGLEVRSTPEPNAEPIGTIAANAQDVVVHVCQDVLSDKWCEVSEGRLAGWVPEKFVSTASPASTVKGQNKK